jgi:hypothetical protein
MSTTRPKRVCVYSSYVVSLLIGFLDRIRGFLSNFVGTASGDDVTDGIADMDIGDDDGNPEAQRMRGLKYMSQLVRVYHEHLSV